MTAEGLGSSPLARGLPPLGVEVTYSVGIIPARAGFTHQHEPLAAAGGDHPRSRGVYSSAGGRTWPTNGSSPLARGLHGQVGDGGGVGGIIPARAGFTASLPHLCIARLDHPRSRGVYTTGTTTRTPFPGSSPLARGLPLPGAGLISAPGIIPARAGFTHVALPALTRGRDHPRSRGVYSASAPRATRT